MDDIKELLSFQPVKDRVKSIYGKNQEIFPPEIHNWLKITPTETKQLKDYIEAVYFVSHEKNIVGLKPNEKVTLDQHLKVMHAYYDVLWEYLDFKDYFKKQGINRDFFTALVDVHDFSRYIFNGSYPLRYNDCVSDGLVGKLFPTFPKEYLHSIGWLTGEKSEPNQMNLENLSPPTVISGLVLKAVDTLGKIEPDNTLRNPDDFFAPNKGYDKWLDYQKQMGRFPFPVLLPSLSGRVRHEVTADEYAKKDKKLTNLGITAILQLTNELNFENIRNKADMLVQNEKEN